MIIEDKDKEYIVSALKKIIDDANTSAQDKLTALHLLADVQRAG